MAPAEGRAKTKSLLRHALPFLLLAACGDAQPVRAPAAPSARAVVPVSSADDAGDSAASAEPKRAALPPEDDFSRAVRRMLAKVSKVRALSAKMPVKGQVLDRAAVIKRVRTKAEQDLPKGVMEAQGELLRGLGLIDSDYAFVDGIYELIEGNLAGFYDQHEDTMFILDDLPESAVAETLAHELVHALQDQHFDLTDMLTYAPGDSDRVTAGHALAEGDAMSAMFDLTLGDSRKISVRQLRMAMVASVAFSGTGDKTPRVLQASLIAPYVDGFRFVQELRSRGGWGEVDKAYARLPASTEQLLHVDKYMANEPPLTVKTPALPRGGGVRDQDVLGEQGMRMVFEQWSTNKIAAAAAEGWGGDRFVVGRRDASDGAEWGEHAAPGPRSRAPGGPAERHPHISSGKRPFSAEKTPASGRGGSVGVRRRPTSDDTRKTTRGSP